MKNYRFLQLLIIASIAILLGSCAQKGNQVAEFEKVQHYRQILFSETPWDVIQGSYKITAEEAKTTNNYKFTYDDTQHLIEIDFCRGDSLLDDSDLGASKVVITYLENKEIRHYFDKNNEPKTVNGEVFKAVYEMDEAGFKTGLKFYGKDSLPIENRNKIGYYTWSQTKDSMIKENRFTLAGKETVMNEFCPFYELRFSYDDRGFVKRMANYMADTLYDCTAENCGSIGVSYFLFNISDKGDLLEFSVHNTSGQMSNLFWGWAKFTQKFEKNGYVTERAMYDQDNEFLGGKSVPIRQYTYDETGLMLEEKCLDGNYQLMNNPSDSVAVKQFKYDNFGVKLETTLFDKDMVKKES
jgi:hypothetical protein